MSRNLKEKIADIIFENTWEYGADMAMKKCQDIAEKICDTVKNECEEAISE